MLVPLDWLAEYVDLPQDVTGEQVAARLVSVGLEEEGLYGGDVTGPLVAGRVLEVSPEPQKNGKVISWCQVDVGNHGQRVSQGTAQGIVCGAPNLTVGDLVAVILPGGVLPGGMAISARKTYGHLSAGMICSARELGLGQDGDGIIVLGDYLEDGAADLEPGDDLIGVLGLDTETVEVNVTPDRGYCFSIRGIAREYSHATGATFSDPVAAARRGVDKPGDESGFPVQIEDEAPMHGVAGCDRYVARVVRGLDLEAPTPRWMQRRLSAAGMRPISLAVDVTNYVMLATGQPLHAFDLSTLNAPISVRRARDGESLITLDGVSRGLHPEDLLITDRSQVLALAGVMGAESSEVGPDTTDVLIESAHFDARSVGRTARRHRLPSEASKRFERGVDPDVADVAAQMACDLLVELGGGRLDRASTDLDNRPAPVFIDLEPDLPTRYVGVAYSPARVLEILEQIGCRVHAGGDAEGRSADDRTAQPGLEPSGLQTLRVWPPSWRPDLSDPTTLVEEVARIDGYDEIPSVVPTAPGGRGLTHPQRLRRVVATALAGQGLAEVLTYPFIGPERLAALGLSATDPRADAVRLANPLSDEAPLMRTEVLQTLVETLRRNVARGTRDVSLFEMDTVARAGTPRSAPTPGTGARPDASTLERIHAAVPHQRWHVGIIASGAAERAGWWGAGRAAQASDAVAWARSVAETAGLQRVRAVADVHLPWHPGRCVRLEVPAHTETGTQAVAEVVTEGGTAASAVVLGWAGELHPKVIAALGLPERTVAAEVDLDALAALSTEWVQARALSVHPPAVSDVALSLPRTVPNIAIEDSLRQGAGPLLESIALFDVYVGEQVAAQEKSLAFRLVFRAPDRTLRTDEVNEARDAAIRRAGDDHGARQR
ncbi:MAG: phenylalanine--tRNA ligase subunit beta [Ornithinimicrobium sp.]